MKRNKLNSATTIVLALSFLQPLPGLAQSASTFTCLQSYGDDFAAGENACLSELIATGVSCDPNLPEASGGDGSLEAIAARISSIANAQACAAEASSEAQAAAEAAAAAEAEANAQAAAEAAVAEEQAATAAAEAAAAEEQAAAEAAAAAAEAAAAEEQAAAIEAEAAAEAQAAEAAAVEAQAIAEAEAAAANAAAEAQASEAASAEAQATAEAEAAANAEADAANITAAAEAEAAAAEAEASAELEAQAADALAAALAAEAAAVAGADADALAAAIAATEAADAAATEARAQAEAEAEAAARAAAEAQECVVELVDVNGATLCADNMSQAEISAITAEATTQDEVAVTTEVVSQEASRTSDQEFAQSEAGASNGGLSNLERVGIFALGALAIGTILSNGRRVTAQTDDRVVLQDQYGNYSVLKNEDILVQTPGSSVRTETYSDGSMRTFVTRDDGVQIVTISNAQGRVLRRSRIDLDGNEVLLIDDMRQYDPIVIRDLPRASDENFAYVDETDTDALRDALYAAEQRDHGRTFSLSQVREYHEVRNLEPEINLDNITFASGSAAISPSEAEELRAIGLLMLDMIYENPRELFLIEGYTDAVGDESNNLLLSDRRAETVALALTEYFGVWPENMVVQGYGERFLKVPTLQSERLNRRVAVRRITNLVD